MHRSRASSPDRLGRAGAIAIAAGRIGIGLGATAATRPALRLLGFSEPGEAAVALARMAGVRDLALAAHALTARDERAKLRQASVLGAVVDAGDAAAFAALAARRGLDRTVLINLPVASSAAIAGAIVAARLRG